MTFGPFSRWVFVVLSLGGAVAQATSLTAAPSVQVAAGQVTIWWTTDVSATTEVYYGPASQTDYSGYPSHSTFLSTAGTIHTRTLLRVPAGTYYYRARSVDGVGSSAVSTEGTFVVPSAAPFPSVQVNGSVNAIARIGSTYYIGGSFTQVNVAHGVGAEVDATDAGLATADQPLVLGPINVSINTVVSDGAGGFFIGGFFSSVGGLPRQNLAHILPDRGVDPL